MTKQSSWYSAYRVDVVVGARRLKCWYGSDEETAIAVAHGASQAMAMKTGMSQYAEVMRAKGEDRYELAWRVASPPSQDAGAQIAEPAVDGKTEVIKPRNDEQQHER